MEKSEEKIKLYIKKEKKMTHKNNNNICVNSVNKKWFSTLIESATMWTAIIVSASSCLGSPDREPFVTRS